MAAHRFDGPGLRIAGGAQWISAAHTAWLIGLSALLVMAALLLAWCAVSRARALLAPALPQCIAAHWMRSTAIAATVCCLTAVLLIIGL